MNKTNTSNTKRIGVPGLDKDRYELWYSCLACNFRTKSRDIMDIHHDNCDHTK